MLVFRERERKRAVSLIVVAISRLFTNYIHSDDITSCIAQ